MIPVERHHTVVIPDDELLDMQWYHNTVIRGGIPSRQGYHKNVIPTSNFKGGVPRLT